MVDAKECLGEVESTVADILTNGGNKVYPHVNPVEKDSHYRFNSCSDFKILLSD